MTPDTNLKAYALALSQEMRTSTIEHPRSFYDCLSGARDQMEDSEFRRVLGLVNAAIGEGGTLYRIMADHPDVFDEEFRTVVRYGMMYGELDDVLDRYVNGPFAKT